MLDSQPVIINEIAWMGDTSSWRNEWVELKNTTNQIISLDNWSLIIDEKINKLNGTIEANGFFLVSKNNPLLLKSALNNKGSHLTLLNHSNRIVDELDFSSGWPFGSNETKRTLERSGDNWQTSLNINGTPGKENSKIFTQPLKLSDIEIENGNSRITNDFLKIFFQGLLTSFFITIISLYLNLKIKKYIIKN